MAVSALCVAHLEHPEARLHGAALAAKR